MNHKIIQIPMYGNQFCIEMPFLKLGGIAFILKQEMELQRVLFCLNVPLI